MFIRARGKGWREGGLTPARGRINGSFRVVFFEVDGIGRVVGVGGTGGEGRSVARAGGFAGSEGGDKRGSAGSMVLPFLERPIICNAAGILKGRRKGKN
jgi:hypothetical protein